MDHATRVSFQLLNVNAHTITISKFRSFKQTQGLMNKPWLAFVSTSRHTTFWTLARVLLYGHVVHFSSSSVVLASRHKRIATVGDIYTGNAMRGLGA
jgi:hypothetical protein